MWPVTKKEKNKKVLHKKQRKNSADAKKEETNK